MQNCQILSNNNEICYNRTAYKKSCVVNQDLSFHFALNGNEDFIVKKRKLSVFSDSFLTLNSGTSYTNIVDSPYPVQLLSIYFDRQFVEDFSNSWLMKDAWLLEKMNDEQRHDRLILNETIYPFKGDMKYNIGHLSKLLAHNPNDELLLNEHLYHCLINYHFLYKKEIFERAEKLQFLQKGTRDEIYRRLSLAKEYLYSNYNQNISLQQLASYSFMSVNHLLRMFKQAFDLTPHQFLMRLRLQRAKLYLENTDHPVNEIVTMIGLNCSSSFIELFRQRYAITPSKYRKEKFTIRNN